MPARKPLDPALLARQEQLRAARLHYHQTGDEQPLRGLTLSESRYVAERLARPLAPWAKVNVNGHRRKYSDPLFVTPHGLLHAFPEKDDDLFLDSASAWAAIAKFGGDAQAFDWLVYDSKLEALRCTKRYLRWSKDVKSLPEGVAYKAPREALEASFAVYSAGGKEALRARYTRTHCAWLLRKFREQGWLPPASPDRWTGLQGIVADSARWADASAARRTAPPPSAIDPDGTPSETSGDE